MASRVLYGLAGQRELPAALGQVNRHTRTPLVATGAATTLVLALALPLLNLAEVTARLTLIVFASVNVSLIAIKRREISIPIVGYVTPQ